MLLSDDPNFRERVLRSNDFWFDCDRAKLEKLINEIISIEELSERLNIVQKWRESSAAVFYNSLEQTLRDPSNGSLSVEKDLLPLSIEGILRHFRLDKNILDSDSFKNHWNLIAESLLSDEGFEIALDRLAGLPVKLPSLIIEELGRLAVDERQELFKNLSLRWSSPVCKLHLIDLALNFFDDGTFVTELVQKTLNQLYSEDEKINFLFFETLLKWINDEFSHSSEFKQLSSISKLAIIWFHTSKLHNVLLQNIDTSGINHFLDEFQKLRGLRQISSSIFDYDPTYQNDVLHPSRINQMILIVYGLATIILEKEKSIEFLVNGGLIGKIKTFATIHNEQQEDIIHPHFLLDLTLAENQLNSFVRANKSYPISFFFRDRIASQVSSENLKSTVKEAIDNLSKDSLSDFHWKLMFIMVNSLPIYDDLVDELKALILKIDFIWLFNSNNKICLNALYFASGQIKYISDESLYFKLENRIVYIARLLSQNSNDEIINDLEMLLLECIYRLSVKLNNPNFSSQVLSNLLLRIFNVWPTFLKNRSLSKMAQELPAYQLHDFWNVVLLHRALH
ncbi:hypothetical protein VB715_21035 [Crocosphaera sp. UHCC 0190]|uniref:hypothetical protein n=1 Tax=Crocosphaera sp. UHCC 0190 TaxID=3110246 RepID=UPI002B2008ED|nr:hypothetical protein [Crocosphaera sp. UHCC 0190]MEA5512260.1 hypothetical protein [Crocosphaera sp. UHCC 0190]